MSSNLKPSFDEMVSLLRSLHICQELNMPVHKQVGFETKNGVNMTNMESTCNQSTENSVNAMEINREQGSYVAVNQEKYVNSN
jgi:dUTPase